MMTKKEARWIGAAAGVTLATTLAWSSPAEAKEKYGSNQTFWQGLVGFRAGFVNEPGFDAFAGSNELMQLSVGVGRTVIAEGRLSLALVGFYDYGARDSTIREESTELDVHRITLGPELRYHVLERLYVYVRGVPGALRTEATLTDTSTGVKLSEHAWVAAVDGMGGIAYQVLGPQKGDDRPLPRFWMAAEGGYGWAATSDLSMTTTAELAPERVQALDLGPLAVRGPMFRLFATATF